MWDIPSCYSENRVYMSNLQFFCQIRLLCPENIDKMLKLSLLAADKADVTWQRFIELNIENLYQMELILCYLQFIQLWLALLVSLPFIFFACTQSNHLNHLKYLLPPYRRNRYNWLQMSQNKRWMQSTKLCPTVCGAPATAVLCSPQTCLPPNYDRISGSVFVPLGCA